MVHQPAEMPTTSEERHVERVNGEITAQRVRHLPAHDTSTEDVDNERHVDPTGVGLDVSEVRDPETIGRRRHEAAIDEVARAGQSIVAERRAFELAPPPSTTKTQLANCRALQIGSTPHRSLRESM
jgi:hypothetical protein